MQLSYKRPQGTKIQIVLEFDNLLYSQPVPDNFLFVRFFKLLTNF